MSSLPHSRPLTSYTRLAALALFSLAAGSCGFAGEDEPRLIEQTPTVIETGESSTATFEDLGDRYSIDISDDAIDDAAAEDKLIVRHPAERFDINLTGMPATDFGSVDLDLLQVATGTKIDYTVHSTALSLRVGRNGHSIRQRFDPSIDGSPRVEFATSIPDADDEAWLSYRVFFEPKFEWNKGGKLPGLAGGTHPTSEGADGTDGFSARIAWMPNGQMGVYLYHPDRPDELGDLQGTFGSFQRQQWHEITQRVVMNSPGQSDGVLEVWLDDQIVFSDTTMQWRTTGTFGADVFLYSAFYGGATSDWAPEETNYVRMADFSVTSTGVTPDEVS